MTQFYGLSFFSFSYSSVETADDRMTVTTIQTTADVATNPQIKQDRRI